MSQVITPPQDIGPMPALSLMELNALRQGLEEAVALVLRGEASGVVILAPRDNGCRAWHAGPTGAAAAGACQLALVRARFDAEPEVIDAA